MHQRYRSIALVSVLLSLTSFGTFASEPDWSEGIHITNPRSNPYSLSDEDFDRVRLAGLKHTLEYPVEISGSFVPWRPLKNFLDNPSTNPIRAILKAAFKGFTNIRSMDDLAGKLGLHSFPKNEAEGSLEIPMPREGAPKVRMGMTIIRKDSVDALTISCAACHSSNLFGKRVLGLTNRFPRMNEFFVTGKKIVGLVPDELFAASIGATAEESALYAHFRTRLRSVGARTPIALGLDTSLAQVALSLAHRSDDEYASFDRKFERSPRPEKLSNYPSDSKPAVWWNLKYKNRWLSDGSVVSGNPVYTNFLWNEIGRGTDLHELEDWLDKSRSVIEELTTAVFASEAPRFTDFFPAERIDIDRAKQGEALFNVSCKKCHGIYVKNWSLPDSDRLTLSERLKTAEVRYLEKTPVINVGTDPHRRIGMESLERGLNPLAISKKNGILIRAQQGYVPPPLVGIWARFPYFHNNSVPNLCALLSRESERPETYWSGEMRDPEKDFDSECVGYPTGDKTPKEWKKNSEHLYDTAREGMSRSGHDERIFIKDGVEIFSKEQKRDLIEFLKTL